MGYIRFPRMGFEVFVEKSFPLFKLDVAFYGVIMALSMVFGAIVAYREAKRTGQKVDDYIDYTIFGILAGIIGARLYYVAFDWDNFKNNLGQIFNLRSGGMAIYGAVIGAAIAAVIFCKVKKIKFWKFVDTAVFGLLTGQIIGRWGNFFNRECYGSFEYTLFSKKIQMPHSIFTMQIPYEDAAVQSEELTVYVNGERYIECQPTFLYESVLNLILIFILMIFRDKKKFYGENFCRYLMGYGIIRFFIEGFRTDQLQLKGVAVSQVLSAVLFAVGLITIIVMRIRLKGKESQIDPIPAKKSRKAKASEEQNDDEEEAAVEENVENDDLDTVVNDVDEEEADIEMEDITEEDAGIGMKDNTEEESDIEMEDITEEDSDIEAEEPACENSEDETVTEE